MSRRARFFLLLTPAIAAIAAACSDDSDPSGAGASPGTTGATGGGGESTTTAALSSTSSGVLPPSFTVTGVVVDQDGAPVDQAIVMQGGGTRSMLTGPDGTFSWEVTDEVPGERVIVAAKIGYRTAGEPFASVPDGPVTITLFEVAAPDNAQGYEFGHPGVGDPLIDNSTLYCGHCHTTFAAEFNQSAHARATRDPRVQDLYAGAATAWTNAAACAAAGGEWRDGTVPGSPATSAPRCYVGDGALPDLNDCGAPGNLACDDPALPAPMKPTQFGACADCHALGMDGPSGGRDLLEAEGIGFEFGNHCDACHHVRDVDLSLPPGGGGRLVMQRPREKIGDRITGMTRQAMFGPYPDVPNPFMGGSYQPKFMTAELCAGCHQQKQEALLEGSSLDPARWPDGLPTHSTFEEWEAGPFTATPCQGCHMPPKFDLFNSVDVSSADEAGITFGFGRPADRLRSHSFRGPLMVVDGMPRLLDGAAQLDVVAGPAGGQLEVTTTVENIGCGHALPTGEPMRALLLVLRVEGCGAELVQTAGATLDDLAGAIEIGVVGVDATVAGNVVTWTDGAAKAQPGQLVRVVRASGTFVDYEGPGFFSDPNMPADEKGFEIDAAIGRGAVVSVVWPALTLDASIAAQPGDRIFLVDPLPTSFVDGDPSRALGGLSGMSFSRVLVDPSGRRRVPHYRAIDIVRDNRLSPVVPHVASHAFAVEPGCTEATVTATLLYRPHPLDLSKERGWDARDFVVRQTSVTVPTP
ncbi:MAG: carboxypeptidase regulatory-like domain-containing protein [Polyangiaceae bacterium]|nr:carboxypeptidase regulatory-like domain-containing protein [Polyangiaceae bacterium]